MDASTATQVIAVAMTGERAGRIVEKLAAAGFEASATTDIGGALGEEPTIMVVDPKGWEMTLHTVLSDYDERAEAPPAVLLFTDDSMMLCSAGPAFDILSPDADGETTRALLDEARVRHHVFVQNWPGLLVSKRASDLARIEYCLENRTGLQIRADRFQTFVNAVTERVVARLASGIQEYGNIVKSGEDGDRELGILTSLITVGETHFWRYSGQMEALKNILTSIHAGKKPGEPLRIWCAGCSTGEEPYSVVMAALEGVGEDAEIEVLATDINPVSLDVAKKGAYTKRSLRNLPTRLMAQWFVLGGGYSGLQVCREVRDRVRFELLNLCADELDDWVVRNGPFDAVFCRNVTIYFSHEASVRLRRSLIDSLNPGGGLFLGSAEAMMPVPDDLEVVHEAGSFFYKKTANTLPKKDKQQKQETGDPVELDTEDSSEYHLGLDALGHDDHETALNIFTKMVNKYSGCPMGNTGLAIILANQGREVEARQQLTGVIETGEEPAEANYMLGLLDERAGQSGSALEHYNRAIENNSKFFMAHFNRAWIFKKRGQSDLFKAEMRKAFVILRSSQARQSWATGGFGIDAILGMVAEAGEGCGDADDG